MKGPPRKWATAFSQDSEKNMVGKCSVPPEGQLEVVKMGRVQPQRQHCSEVTHTSSLGSNLDSSRMLSLMSPGSSQTFCQEGDEAKKYDTATCLPGCSSTFASSRFHLQRSVLDRSLLSYSQQVRLEPHTALGALPRAAPGEF